MLSVTRIVLSVCAVLAATATLSAGEVCEKEACSECQQCPVGKAMDELPKLVYRIGDETTTSPVEAGRIATRLKQKVKFTVGEKVFGDEPEAFAAMVDATEKMVANFAKPQKCEASGQTLVAGKSLCCDESAGQLAKLVKTAMDEVKVTYQVGGESVCCPDAAKTLAKESGKKVIQLVAGQKCGGCGTTTRLAVARAKYKAAIEALLAADETSKTKDADNQVTAS